MTTMSREALFKAVWDRPLTEVVADLGVSDVGLKKICNRHHIPTPGRGYWAQVRAGRVFPQPKLRPAHEPQLDEVEILGARPLPQVVKAAMDAARSRAVDDAGQAHAPSDPGGEAPEEGTPRAARRGAVRDGRPETQDTSDGRAELKATRKALAKARPGEDRDQPLIEACVPGFIASNQQDCRSAQIEGLEDM
ncbi:MAG: hypothetical protein Q7T23_13870 [Phenylobacterium sp.]|nr:hypothetical protein [Phenylobacterium sp.]